jgi:hypothetical protein
MSKNTGGFPIFPYLEMFLFYTEFLIDIYSLHPTYEYLINMEV